MDNLSDLFTSQFPEQKSWVTVLWVLPQENVDVLEYYRIVTFNIFQVNYLNPDHCKIPGSIIKTVETLITCVLFFCSVQNVYRDTYRIVTPVSRYVSYREVTVSFHPYQCVPLVRSNNRW